MGTTRRDHVIRAARGVVALLERGEEGQVYFLIGKGARAWDALRDLWDAVRFEQAATVPTVVTLCGSTRYYDAFQRANFAETLAGRIVLSVGFYPHSAGQAHGEWIGITPEQKEALDQLHLRKLDLCDEALILNVDDYVGQSTMRELGYARAAGKRVRWLLPSRYALEGEGVG